MQGKLPLLSKTGFAFAGFLLLSFAFVIYDRPNGNIEVVKGVITQHHVGTSKNEPNNQRCIIQLGNGFKFLDYCSTGAKVGDVINVCIQDRKFRGNSYYTNGCLF
jgi:hypothetical protein